MYMAQYKIPCITILHRLFGIQPISTFNFQCFTDTEVTKTGKASYNHSVLLGNIQSTLFFPACTCSYAFVLENVRTLFIIYILLL
jgi:hypothetical protein